MADLKQYIASSGAGELPAEAELDVLLARCEWFDLARIVREIATGRPASRLDVTAPWRAQSSLRMAAVDAEALCRLSSDDIIDRVLREEDLRIVAADGETDIDLGTAVAEVQQMVVDNPLGTDIDMRIGGPGEELGDSSRSPQFPYGLAIFLGYLVMACLLF